MNTNNTDHLNKDSLTNRDFPKNLNPEKIVDRFNSRISAMSESVRSFSSHSKDYIVKNPTKGILYAAATGVGTGFLLSLWMKRRRK